MTFRHPPGSVPTLAVHLNWNPRPSDIPCCNPISVIFLLVSVNSDLRTVHCIKIHDLKKVKRYASQSSSIYSKVKLST
jgi:hypothetical protein